MPYTVLTCMIMIVKGQHLASLITPLLWKNEAFCKLAYTLSEKEAKFTGTQRDHWEPVGFCNLLSVERLQTLLHAYKRTAMFGLILG